MSQHHKQGGAVPVETFDRRAILRTAGGAGISALATIDVVLDRSAPLVD